MNVTERVASLEALLARVKKNAAEPRVRSTRAAPQLYADPARAGGPLEPSPFDEETALPGEPGAWDTEETAIFTYPPSFADGPNEPLPRPLEPAPVIPAAAKAPAEQAKPPAPKLTPSGTAKVSIDRSKILAALRDGPVVNKGDTDRSPIDFAAALKAATGDRAAPPVEVRAAAPMPPAEPAKAPAAREAAPAAQKQAERSPQPPAAAPKVEAPAPKVEPIAARVEPKPAAPKVEPKPVAPKVEPIAAAKTEPLAAAKVEPLAAAAKVEPKPVVPREEPKAAPLAAGKAASTAALSASRRTAAKTLMGGLTADDLKLPTEPIKATPVRVTPEERSSAKAESALEEGLLAAIVMPGGGKPQAQTSASPAPIAATEPSPGTPALEPKAAAAATPAEPAEKPQLEIVRATEPAAEAAPSATKAAARADIKKAEPAVEPKKQESFTDPVAATKTDPVAELAAKKTEPAPVKEEPAAAKTVDPSRREETTPSKRYPPPTPSPEPRRLSSKLLVGAIAAVVVGGVAYYGIGQGWFDAGTAPVPTVAPPVSTSPITTSPTPNPSASEAAAPIKSGDPVAPEAADAGAAAADAAAEVADAAPADAATTAADAAGAAALDDPANAADLPANMGYITITSPAEGNVYLSGKYAGRAGERIKTTCGVYWVRLARAADPPSPQPAFLTMGDSVIIPCQKAVSATLRVGQPAPNQPPPTDPY